MKLGWWCAYKADSWRGRLAAASISTPSLVSDRENARTTEETAERERSMIPFDETKHPASKRVGVASEATIVTPIKIGRIEREYRTYGKRLEDVLEDVQ